MDAQSLMLNRYEQPYAKSKQEAKQFIIVAVKGQFTQPLTQPETIHSCTAKLKQLKANWRGYILQIRTPEGYKNVKIWQKGLKK